MFADIGAAMFQQSCLMRLGEKVKADAGPREGYGRL
jgi:hypothetical protein